MKKIIKVANIIEESFLGGPQKRIINTCKKLHDKYDTTVILPKNNSQIFVKLLNDNNINFKCININKLSFNFLTIIKYIIFFISDIYKIYAFLRINNFDIIHISGGAWQVKGVIAAKLNKNKVVWQLNDTNLPFLLKIQFKILYKFADKFIYSSSLTKKYYSSIIKKNISYDIIPSGVDTEMFNPTLEFNLKSKYKNILKNKFIVGMVANINPVKGIDDLLNIADNFNNIKDNKIIFLLICNVPASQLKLYHKLIKRQKDLKINNFYILKSVGDIRPLLKEINIYLCLSKYESSPVSVWEALSMGKTILSYDVGDVSKFIKNDLNGFIVKRSIDNIIFNIKKIYKDKNILFKYNQNSRLIAKNQLDIKLSVKKLNNLYESLINV